MMIYLSLASRFSLRPVLQPGITTAILVALFVLHPTLHAQTTALTLSKPYSALTYVSTLQGKSTFLRYQNGVLMQVEQNLSAPTSPNVTAYDTKQKQAWTQTVSVTGLTQVALSSISVNPNSMVTVPGYGLYPNGKALYFIAMGKVGSTEPMETINTGHFLATQTCQTDDGSIWAIGGVHQKTAGAMNESFATLRHYNSSGTLLGSFLQRSSLAVGFETAFRNGAQDFLRCTTQQVYLLSLPNKTLYTVTSSTNTLTSTPVLLQTRTPTVLTGFEVTSSGRMLASTKDDNGAHFGSRGLYELVTTSGSAGLQPVANTLNAGTPGGFRVLIGLADNNPVFLKTQPTSKSVLRRGSVPLTIYWSRLTD